MGCKNHRMLPFTMHIPLDCGPILDAGCGTGLQSTALSALGYGPITGMDLSPGMLEAARQKNIYQDLRAMTMGEPLDFPDDCFGAAFAVGCITPGHAPPESYDELIRVTRPGGHVIYSSRVDPGQEPGYPAAAAAYEAAGRWSLKWRSPDFHMMPELEPSIVHAMFVYVVQG